MAKKKVEKDNSERWLLTYSDLMNLLLILFIILYVSSKADTAKFQQVAASLREGFNSSVEMPPSDTNGQNPSDTSGGEPPAADPNAPVTEAEQIQAEYDQFYAELISLFQQNGIADKVSVALNERGVVITFRDNALFNSASAEIHAYTQDIILKIGGLLSQLHYSFVLVEGHADTVPIHNEKYKDNMDLSTQRAVNVWRLLVSCGLPPQKMACTGYGEYRPIAANDTDANKAANRRVVVSIFKPLASDDPNAQFSTADAVIAGSN